MYQLSFIFIGTYIEMEMEMEIKVGKVKNDDDDDGHERLVRALKYQCEVGV